VTEGKEALPLTQYPAEPELNGLSLPREDASTIPHIFPLWS
jgi:hypothetical protein